MIKRFLVAIVDTSNQFAKIISGPENIMDGPRLKKGVEFNCAGGTCEHNKMLQHFPHALDPEILSLAGVWRLCVGIALGNVLALMRARRSFPPLVSKHGLLDLFVCGR